MTVQPQGPETMTDPGYLTHLSRGGELLKTERLGEAKTEFERALVVRPGDPKALALLGLACFRLALYDEAGSIYKTLVDSSPDDAGLRLNLGLVYLKAGNTEAAAMELDRAIELEPTNGRAKGYLGLAYARLGDFARARDAFREAGQLELAQEMETVMAGAQAVDRPELTPDGSVDVAFDGEATRATGPDESLRRVREEGFEKIEASGGSLTNIDELAARARARGDARWGGPSTLDETTAALVAAAARHSLEQRPRLGGPQQLTSFLHQRLVMPKLARDIFEIQAGGALVVRVSGRLISRTDGVVSSGGALTYSGALRRSKGRLGEEPLGSDDSPVYEITGEGFMIAMPRGGRFTALRLDDDVVYLREPAVYAFESNLRWESGRIPGSVAATATPGANPGEVVPGPGLRFLNLRGDGCCCVHTSRPAVSIQVTPDWMFYVDAQSLVGWQGKVVPRVAPRAPDDPSPLFVECSGEGIVIVEEPASV